MVVEAVQTYVKLVNGLTRATRERARATAHDLLAQVGLEEVANDAEQRVGKLTDEILSASRANRELLEKVVASEVTKAASRLGFVRFDDLDEVREEIAELRAQLARQQGGSTTGAARKAPAGKSPTKQTRTTSPARKTAPGAGRATASTAGAAQRLAAEREAASSRPPTAPRAARARRATPSPVPPSPVPPSPVPPSAPVPDPTADAGA